MTAAAGGTLQIDDPVTNLGLIHAQADSSILITGRLDNENTVQATGPGAQVTLSGGGHNQAEAVIAALSGGLILLDERIHNAGLISASGAGSTVDLDKAVVVGGTVESSDGGVIATTAGQSTFLNVAIASGSTLEADQFSSLDLRGTTTIDGTVTFKGQGSFELHHTAEIVGGSQPAELDNFGTITGAGNIGRGDQHFVLVNEQSGTIDASGRLTLIIDNDSPGTASAPPSNAVINAGVIEATGSGGLTIENTTINNSAAAGTGHVNVFAGSQINLDNATLLQGIISIAAGGELAVVGSSEVGDATVLGGGQVTVDGGQTLTWDAVTLDNVTLSGSFSNAAALTIEDTVTLNVATLSGGTIDDTGTLSVSADSEITHATVNGGGDLTVAIDQTLTFDTVTLDNVTLAGSFSNAAASLTTYDAVTFNGATLAGGTDDLDSATSTVSADSTIQLATLQDGTLAVAAGQTLTLNGLVLDNVTLSGGTDDLDSAFTQVNTDSTIENATLQNGTLAVASDQTLTLDDVTLGSITLSGGTDDLNDTFSMVKTDSMIESATLQHGTLTVASGQTLTLRGVTLDNVTLSSGTVDLDRASHKSASASLVNTDSTIEYATLQDGTLAVTSGQILTLDAVTLGNVVLLGGIEDLDGAISSVSTDSTIQFGTLQNGTLTVACGQMLTLELAALDNVTLSGGTVDLDASTSTVSTDSTIEYARLQDGMLTLSSGQTLTLNCVMLDSVTLSGGTDDLDSSTSTVSSDSSIEFATLRDGTLAVASGQTLTLDGVTLDNVIMSGGIDNLDGATSTVSTDSTIQNATLQDGTLAVASGQTLTLDGTTTLDGTVQFQGDGTFELHRQATIVTTSHAELDNTGTIAGSGTIGTSGMALVNDGAINADDHNGTLILDPATLTNNAVLEAMNGGILDVVSNVTGTGSAAISGGGRLELGGTDAQTVTFDDASTLQLDGTSDFTGTVRGLAVGDIIDLANTIVTSAAWDGTTLSINGAPTTFTISNLPKGDTFAFTSDRGTGTDLTVEAAPTIAINAIEGNDIVNKAEAAAGFTISGTASDSSVAVDGQTVTVDIVNGLDKVVDSYAAKISDGDWSVRVDATDAQGLADGTYTVTANITDVAINPAAPEASQTFTVDTVTPTAAVTIDHSDVNLAANTALVTFSFSEAPTDFTAANITTTGGTLGTLTAVNATTYTATFTAASGTDISNAAVSVDNTWHEDNGNPGTAASTSFTVDTVTPTAAVTVDHSDVNLAANTALVTFSFSETPTDFTAANITTTGGTLGTLTAVNATTYTATFTAASGTDISNAAVSVDNTWHEDNGNPGTAASTSFTVDTVTPTAAVTVDHSDVNLAANTALVTFSFSEAPTDFTAANITTTGGTLGTLTAVNATTYTATFTAASGTDISNAAVSVDNTWHEDNGNPGTAASTSFTVDTVTPTAAVTVDHSDVNLAANTALVTFSFSEAPTDFTAANITTTGGTLGTLTAVNATTYTATFTAASGTDISNAAVSVDNTWHEDNGNPGTAASTSFTVDTVTPTAAVTVDHSDVNLAANTALVTFSFSEAPTDFTAANITTTGGTLGTLTAVNATTYTATFTAASGTDISNAAVSVDNTWHEDNGNPGTAASTSFTVDTVTPTAAVTVDHSDVNLAANTALVTFSFSEAPTDFTAANITTTGGTLGTLTAVNATTYTATFTAASGTDISNAAVSVDNTWHEDNGNPGTAASTSFTVDTVTPTAAVTVDHSDVNLAANTALVTFSFSEAPTDFTAANITTTGGTLGTLTAVNATTYTATFTAASGTDISNAAVSVDNTWHEDNGNPGTAASTSFTVDTVTPTAAVTVDHSDVNLAANTALVTFSFSEAPTDFTAANITTTGGTLGTLTAVNATTYTATFTAASGTDISNAAVSVDNTWHEDNGNPGTAASTSFTVDTVTPTVAVATSNPDVTVAHNTATITFSFSEAPTSFTLADTTAAGGTLGTLTEVNATTYTATFTGAANTDIHNASVGVIAGSWQENNGNPGAAGTTGSFTVDTGEGPEPPTLRLGATTATVSEGGTVRLPAITVTKVDSDDTLTVTIAGLPTGASITNSADRTVFHGGSTITLTGNEVGSTLTLHDGTNDESFQLTVTANNTTKGEQGSSASQQIAVTLLAPPAGVAGSPINLALTESSRVGALTTVTISGMPADWSLNEGENLGNGTWTVETNDLSALTVLTAAAYTGAMVLGVTETWANADGGTGTAFVADNVEAYAPGLPIFAWSGNDTLTGAGGNDLFVFAQPIGNDTIYNFNVATDKIDLTGFAGIAGFGDLAGHIAGDGHGDAVITLGASETITLHGIDAVSLTAGDFVFNQTPVVDNAGTMAVSDGAMLPLSGTIDNSGTIALNSSGDEADLEIVGGGLTLQGGGQIVLSDSHENVIFAAAAGTTLTNVDNAISGAGQIGTGDGNLTLVNEAAGTIDANYSDGTLTLDTGNTVVNFGLMEATNGDTLQITDNVSNSGTLAAEGGTLMADGNVSGSGDVIIGGRGHADFAGAVDQNVAFTGPGTLELDHSQSFSGTVTGFGAGDAIDLNDLAYSANETVTWTQGGGSGTLTVNDNGATENITLNGNYTQGEFALTNNGTAAGGTEVISVPVVDATAVPGTSGVAGDISFADANTSDTFSASITLHGAGYVGAFSLDPVTESNGSESVRFEFSLGDDQINLAPGQTLTQSYGVTVADAQGTAVNQTISVSIGGPGNDNFVFQPGVGADTIANFNAQADTIELDHFANIQNAQELAAPITTDAHDGAVIELGHHDSITLPGVSANYLQAHLHSLVHLS